MITTKRIASGIIGVYRDGKLIAATAGGRKK
jgi:hypothetical protein